MATYSSNTTIKVSGAVAVSGNNTTISYAVPGNSYAIVQVFNATQGITIGGVTAPPSSGGNGIGGTGYYVGPGQTISATSTGAVAISGVVFQNSP